MALEIRQSLSLAQQLIMTPQLQQAIKLLQLSRLELLETIHQELETNPILEEALSAGAGDESRVEDKTDEFEKEFPDRPESPAEEVSREDVDWESYFSDYTSRRAELPHEERELHPIENITAAKTNLYDHLSWQLNLSNLDDSQKELAEHIIGNLNEDGYLDISLEEIAETTGQPLERVTETLKVVQNFDPVGVAARDTRESLLIQAKFHNLGGTIVEKIIMDHLKDLENKKYDHIAKSLSVPLQEILQSISIIQGLEPKPGRSYLDEETIYITPDIYVFKVGDDYQILLNEDGMPKLRINSYYRELLRSHNPVSESAKTYIQDKLRSAAWLIKSIHQRQRTIYKVTESIVRVQRDFLEKGITQLKPLVLRDVAEDIEMHESTVSRVTTNKYVHTPQGVFELKFFFNSSISSVDGDAVASESVKEHIRKIIKTEDKVRPWSDQEIADALMKLNIRVARRTVAKYREAMGILPSRKRKNPY